MLLILHKYKVSHDLDPDVWVTGEYEVGSVAGYKIVIVF